MKEHESIKNYSNYILVENISLKQDEHCLGNGYVLHKIKKQKKINYISIGKR